MKNLAVTLELFNGALAHKQGNLVIDYQNGLIIEGGVASYAKEIKAFYERERLNGNDLNKTFHKSWEKVSTSTRYELLIQQLKHYLSIYGSDFEDTIYIPDEVLNIEGLNLKFKVIKSFTREQLTEKCVTFLKSGIALKQETMETLVDLLMEGLLYNLTDLSEVKNKEAKIYISDKYNIYPTDAVEILRYVVYKSTDKTLLIKNDDLINGIKNSSFNPKDLFLGKEEVLAEIFNRFKPLFLAYKAKTGMSSIINRISKLSKKYHKPVPVNVINKLSSIKLDETNKHWLDNATPYALLKAIQFLKTRKGGQDTFLYNIRSGKVWAEKSVASDSKVIKKNYKFLKKYLKERLSLDGKKFFIEDGISYGLPTSEKMYVGNIPINTKFTFEKLVVGIYWEDSWGARDLDLSASSVDGKIGWNSDYANNNGSLLYSGDMTSAPNGAVEYIHAKNGLRTPQLVLNNVFSGSNTAGYKILVGKGDDISNKYMMNPENLILDEKVNATKKQMMLGIILPDSDNKQSFYLMNSGNGNVNVSGYDEKSDNALNALYQQATMGLTLNKLIKMLGDEFVEAPEDADFDLSINNLERDSFIRIFE